MAKDFVPKFDPNTEAFQMRAQWKKAESCKKQWHERWNWLLEERKLVKDETDAIQAETSAALSQIPTKLQITKSLKPVPVTSTGFIGWLANKNDCQLEIYTSWLTKVPVRLPDAWDNPDYLGPDSANRLE